MAKFALHPGEQVIKHGWGGYLKGRVLRTLSRPDDEGAGDLVVPGLALTVPEHPEVAEAEPAGLGGQDVAADLLKAPAQMVTPLSDRVAMATMPAYGVHFPTAWLACTR